MEKNEYNCYLMLAENISGVQNKRLKSFLPIIVHFRDGEFREFYTNAKVYIGDSYKETEFLEGDASFFINKKSPVDELTYYYAITPYKFYPNYLDTEIVPDIVRLSELTINKKEEMLAQINEIKSFKKKI